MDSIVFTLRQKGLPLDVVYNIIYKQRVVMHPIASIINNKIIECSLYCYMDSGGWEEFDTFTSIYDRACRIRPLKQITLQYYIYGLTNW